MDKTDTIAERLNMRPAGEDFRCSECGAAAAPLDEALEDLRHLVEHPLWDSYAVEHLKRDIALIERACGRRWLEALADRILQEKRENPDADRICLQCLTAYESAVNQACPNCGCLTRRPAGKDVVLLSDWLHDLDLGPPGTGPGAPEEKA